MKKFEYSLAEQEFHDLQTAADFAEWQLEDIQKPQMDVMAFDLVARIGNATPLKFRKYEAGMKLTLPLAESIALFFFLREYAPPNTSLGKLWQALHQHLINHIKLHIPDENHTHAEQNPAQPTLQAGLNGTQG